MLPTSPRQSQANASRLTRSGLAFPAPEEFSDTVHGTSVKELRAVFAPESKRRSFGIGISLVMLISLISAAAFAGVLLTSSLLAKILLGFVLGLGISIMFVIGHDACHDSLTPSN